MNRLRKILPTLTYVLIFAITVPILLFYTGIKLNSLIFHYAEITAFNKIAGLFLIIPGFLLISSAVYSLRTKGKGFPVSSLPPKNLVTTGVYSLSRHPVYVGAVLIFAGASVYINSFVNILLCAPLFFIFYHSYALFIEEPVLTQRFGERYLQYIKEVSFFPALLKSLYSERLFRNISEFYSHIINRPLIVRLNEHIFFWSYGFWNGTGISLGLIVFVSILIFGGVEPSTVFIFTIILSLLCFALIRITWLTSNYLMKKNSLPVLMKRAGFVSWGVPLSDLITGLIFISATGRSIFLWLDAVLTAQMLTHFFGRIGCSFYGCCYGKETHGGLYLDYRDENLKAIRENNRRMKRYPIQIFSALYGLYLFLTIILIWKFTYMPAGFPAVLILFFYSSFRFCEEWCRNQKVTYFNLSAAQAVSLALIAISIFLLGNLQRLNVGILYPPFNLLTITGGLGLRHIAAAVIIGLTAFLLLSYHRFKIGSYSEV